jgi:hypothetical protein
MKTKITRAGSIKLAIVIALMCATWAGSAIAQKPRAAEELLSAVDGSYVAPTADAEASHPTGLKTRSTSLPLGKS